LSYRTAPIELLDQLAVPREQLGKALADLTARDHVTEAMVLSTCNRVEVYAHVTRYHGGLADLRGFFADWSGRPPEDFVDCLVDHYDDAAAAHLFAVTAGLDSMVVGERQIHLQVKQAFSDATAEGACGSLLGRVARQALRVGKRVRTETGVSRGAASMVDVGLAAAERALASLDGRAALVVGAGKMGGMTAARLAQRCRPVMVANRGEAKRVELAERVGGEPVALESLTDGLARADVVVCSTASAGVVIDSEQVAEAMADRESRPLALIDLAVPRDVDPGCGELAGVRLADVTDVRAEVDEGAVGDDVAAGRAIVAEEAEAFASWMRSRRVTPTIRSLRARGEQIRQEELDRVESRLSELSEKERAAVEKATKGILNTLLHEPTVRLKAFADGHGAGWHAQVLSDLFGLEPDDAEGVGDAGEDDVGEGDAGDAAGGPGER
jgi:glutamyl-tRNA reductase